MVYNLFSFEPKKIEHKPPKICIVCGCTINEGNWYNVGYDRFKIWLETCDNVKCKQWLKWKVRKKVPWK